MDLLQKHFDIALETPDGIERLRALVLMLGIQGKLVPQDPKDQSVKNALAEIKAERLRLEENGTIRARDALPALLENQYPFAKPASWEFIRIGDFLEMINGRAFKPTEWIAKGMPIVRIQNLNNPNAPFNYCNEKDVSERHIIDDNTMLISWSGTPGTSFGAFIWQRGRAALNQHIFKCFQVGAPYVPEFLVKAINSQLHILISQAHGAVGLQHVTKGTLENLVLSLPPLAEQKRIVAKIDQLMSLCDKLEAERNARDLKRVTVHTAAMNRLLAAPDKPSFDSSWQFITKHFDELYSVKPNVTELKKAILQLAVMGKLVQQDPNDQPASELLKEIEAEKARPVKDGKIKKQEPLPAIKAAEIPYALPHGWEWVRLGSCLKKITDGTHHSPPNGPTGDFLYISAKNIKADGVLLSNATYVTRAVHQEIYSRCDPEQGDLLFIKDGATTGIVTINNLKEPFSMLSSVALLKMSKGINNQFLLHSLRSPLFYSEIRSGMTGVAITRVTLKILNEAIVPLPPLAEQQRIVAKIDQLMALCDALEKQIGAATEKKTAILNAVLAGV